MHATDCTHGSLHDLIIFGSAGVLTAVRHALYSAIIALHIFVLLRRTELNPASLGPTCPQATRQRLGPLLGGCDKS